MNEPKKSQVEVLEIASGDGQRIIAKGEVDYDIHVSGVPTHYMLVRMEKEDGRFFLVRWQGDGNINPYHHIPKGIVVASHVLGLSHNHTLYNEHGGVIGNYEDFSLSIERQIIFVRIFRNSRVEGPSPI